LYRFDSSSLNWVEEGFAAGDTWSYELSTCPNRYFTIWEGRNGEGLGSQGLKLARFTILTQVRGEIFDQGIIKASAKVGEKLANPVSVQ